MSEITFEVVGMTCAHCEKAVTDELSRLPGVEKVVADAATGRVSVSHTAASVDRQSWESAVGEAGYEVAAWPATPDA